MIYKLNKCVKEIRRVLLDTLIFIKQQNHYYNRK